MMCNSSCEMTCTLEYFESPSTQKTCQNKKSLVHNNNTLVYIPPNVSSSVDSSPQAVDWIK